MSNPHLHKATVTLGDAINRPYHAQCSCATAGDFAGRDAAITYIVAHFAKLGGITETYLVIDAPDEAKAVAPPASDPKHVPGIGVMPSSHAPGPASAPPPPPAPPSAKDLAK
jgi:hypothetical protein